MAVNPLHMSVLQPKNKKDSQAIDNQRILEISYKRIISNRRSASNARYVWRVCMGISCAWLEKKDLVYEDEAGKKEIKKKSQEGNETECDRRQGGNVEKHKSKKEGENAKKIKERNIKSLYASMSLRRF